MVYRLPDDDYYFPDPLAIPPADRETDGMIAIGGDLHPYRLIEAYSIGIFPWTSYRALEVPEGKKKSIWNELRWYCPMTRFVIFPEKIHISHSMRTLLNKGKYSVTFDKDFEGVINQCSALRIHEMGAWLGPQMVEAYTKLHEMGVAHSVEVWDGEKLVGGLYGVVLQGVFMGESMFSLVPSASKVALISLAQDMAPRGGKMIDCQFRTEHLMSMGGESIPYEQYLEIMYGKEI